MWAKAVRSFRSRSLPELDRDAAFTLAYQAALQLATALIRAALGELSEAARDLNVIRQRRHSAIYDWEGATSEQDLATVRASTLHLFAAGHAWLARTRPALTPGLSDFPRSSG